MDAFRVPRKQSDQSMTVAYDEESDYGTDIDENILDDILSNAQNQPLDEVVLTSIEQDPVTEHAIIHLRSSGQVLDQGTKPTEGFPITVSAAVEYSTAQPITSTSPKPSTEKQQTEAADIANDDRSPLERFRAHPKKPLSVTDMVSPAWCEQQYLFALSKHGRVRRTPAMKQGSKVHKVLEEQVHTTIKIEVKTREDMFGLKLWNVIQGLRTLRATGITREFEVWGVLDDQVINGVIDEVTTQCPDKVFEQRILQQEEKPKDTLEEGQMTLAEFYRKSAGNSLSSMRPALPKEQASGATFYIVDVKTRQSRTLPADDGRLRPTRMQLMLYHRLLSSLASGKVDKNAIFHRYRLDGTTIFSDTFIAEMSKLDLDAYLDLADEQADVGCQDSVAELLANNSLNALWTYMIEEFCKTFPNPSLQLSSVLAAEFRTGDTGALLGKRPFQFDASKLDAYVQDELHWWKGERPTKGVEIEEAFKCRMCEFAEECSWRKGKIEETVQKTRLRKAATPAAASAASG